MAEYLVPDSNPESISELVEQATEAGIAGAIEWETREDGSIVARSETLSVDELAAVSTLTAAWSPALPAELRSSAAADWIKQSAGRTNAQLDGAFPAGAQRELAYTVRALCRALIVLVDPRLGR